MVSTDRRATRWTGRPGVCGGRPPTGLVKVGETEWVLGDATHATKCNTFPVDRACGERGVAPAPVSSRCVMALRSPSYLVVQSSGSTVSAGGRTLQFIRKLKREHCANSLSAERNDERDFSTAVEMTVVCGGRHFTRRHPERRPQPESRDLWLERCGQPQRKPL